MNLSPRDAAARHFDNHPFCPPGAPVILAVSGGPDSMVLLDAVVHGAGHRGHRFIVAHLHHGIRGADADLDHAFVKDAAHSRDLEFHSKRVDVPAIAAAEKLSLEDAARRARRAFLEEVRVASGAAATALGHTRDDQAETLLMNLLRGAGPKGLAAMPEYGPGRLTRPLLGVSRADVLAHVEAHGLPYREDATNSDLDMTRNRIRHELLPLIRQKFNPNIADTLARQAGLFAEIDAWLVAESARGLAQWMRTDDGARSFDTGDLDWLPLPLLRKLLRAAIRDLTGNLEHVGHAHIDALVQLVTRTGSGHADLPGVAADREGARLWLRAPDGAVGESGHRERRPGPEPSEQRPVSVPLAHGTEVTWGGARIRVSLVAPGGNSGALRPPDGRRSAWFDADRLGGSPTLRALRPGDRIRPYGMTGRRKVSDVLVDLKIPAPRRTRFPALVQENAGGDRESPDEILWIPGVMRGSGAPVTTETGRLLMLDLFGPTPADERGRAFNV